MNEPNMGKWEYKYDALGQLRWQKDAKGQTSTMRYDVLGRMTHRFEKEGSTVWKYDWRPVGKGKLAQVATSTGYTKDVFYDGFGREERTRTNAAGKALTVQVSYDSFSRVKQTTILVTTKSRTSTTTTAICRKSKMSPTPKFSGKPQHLRLMVRSKTPNSATTSTRQKPIIPIVGVSIRLKPVVIQPVPVKSSF